MRACRECGCTEDNCRGCIERTGAACFWIGEDLCSACAPDMHGAIAEFAEFEARAIAESLELPGALIVIMDHEGHLHAGVCAVPHPIAGPVIEIAATVREVLAKFGRIAGDPPPRAICVLCHQDLGPFTERAAAIQAHAMSCELSPAVAAIAKLRGENQRLRRVLAVDQELREIEVAAIADADLDVLRWIRDTLQESDKSHASAHYTSALELVQRLITARPSDAA